MHESRMKWDILTDWIVWFSIFETIIGIDLTAAIWIWSFVDSREPNKPGKITN